MIGFVVALEKEAEYFVKEFNNLAINKIAGKTIYIGNFYNKNCVLIISGIGKVNSAISTQILIDKYAVKTIVNFGTAGGILGQTEILNYYVINKACQYDFDCSKVTSAVKGQIPNYSSQYFNCYLPNIDLETKNLASSDRFTYKKQDFELIKHFKASVYDMEGAAICQTAFSNGVNVICIKGISDLSDGKNANEFITNLDKISKGFVNIILKLLQSL